MHVDKQIGENGMPEYSNIGIGSDVLALNQLVRGGDPTSMVRSVLQNGTPNQVADLFVMVFVTRNCRGGKGEKKLSFDTFLETWRKYPDTAQKLLALFPHYGYWKDLLLLMVQATEDKLFFNEKDLSVAAMRLMKEQLTKDLAELSSYKNKLKECMDETEIKQLKSKGPEISLLAKWLPREGSSLDKQVEFVQNFTCESGTEWQSKAKAQYRRQVTELTSFLDLPEVLLAAKREEEIKFGRVASKATMNLRRVFLNELKDGGIRSRDPKRIALADRFLRHVVKKGLKGAQLMPHEIVKKIMHNHRISKTEELVLDAQWKDLWKNVLEQTQKMAETQGCEFSPSQMVALCDVSGSMGGLPMEVAIALSLGISEITHSAFRGMILTFESQPRWHIVDPSDSIAQKVRSLMRAPWGGSTDFAAAYDMILEVARSKKLSRDEMPSLIVFSDMQFNVAAGYGGGYYYGGKRPTGSLDTMHDAIRKKFARVAKELGWSDAQPNPIVYWNLRNTGGHPVDKDTANAVLLSGFSPSLLKLVMYGDALAEQEVEVVDERGNVTTQKVTVTPEELLRKMIDDPVYDPVREILVQSREGKLLEYEIPLSGSVATLTEGEWDQV